MFPCQKQNAGFGEKHEGVKVLVSVAVYEVVWLDDENPDIVYVVEQLPQPPHGQSSHLRMRFPSSSFVTLAETHQFQELTTNPPLFKRIAGSDWHPLRKLSIDEYRSTLS